MTIDLIYATWPDRSCGTGWRKMAAALRDAGLTRHLTETGFEVGERLVTAEGQGAGDLKAAFELGAQIGALVKASRNAGGLPIIICGSCAVAAMGAIAGLGGGDTGLLWMDAHADLNTPDTTLSGLFDGMAVSIALGDAWRAMAFDIAGVTPVSRRNLCFYGVRDLDPAEREIIDQGLPVAEDAGEAISALESCAHLYLHLDMDVHDAGKLRVNRYGVPGGPSPDQVRADLETIASGLPVAAFSVTSLDPDIAKGPGAAACAIAHIEAVCKAREFA
jgi:arginase